jgi:uncharacterized protein (DUF2344 family)
MIAIKSQMERRIRRAEISDAYTMGVASHVVIRKSGRWSG